ncbi:multidrug ABC transporter ATP-binding protein [Microvirga sp. KLBC 81]|uniref:ribosome-associated ATPase/putative transporter RbbA n=1 Tax=Microvirga sp. KLBC 81 TaxID=1862707 RepID=UPI000D513916|nr:ribosome-associated ATPase/putative transporter RbbA [Microvirga sp. KLBC 81]PVE24062.1 multidrug ABC transporter ATP-binding protein [Microvirga sp. KLBC 81]
MPSRDAVRLEGLTHRYGKILAADNISICLPLGSATAVVGPDGVGKSTMLGLIAGVRRLQEGTLEVLGGSMADAAHRNAIAARIAYMPQGLGRNLYPTLSVAENIDFHARLFGLTGPERKTRLQNLLAATGLDPFPDRPAGKLSGGMKQKLSLCCALVHDPDLLILDEPTTGVDPLSRRQFWTLIARIRAGRPAMTVIVATAYMEEAESFDRVMAIEQGRVIAAGETRDVLAQTGASTLEEAYRSLQTGAKPEGHFTIGPRAVHDGASAIVAEGLTRRFGDFTAVDHVSFRIERGEIFGFLGSNGCGKTTTMKMLTGLLPATEGRAELFGKAVDAGDLDARMRVGYMSQGFSLYEELTVRGNLELHARLYRVPPKETEERIVESLQRFQLIGVADDLPARVPLGLRQRLQLAAACLHRPQMLILDEPTSGVDPAARDLFWRHLAALSRDEGVTIFVSTHFMNEAERCDRISLMHRGRVLAMGTPAELVASRNATTLEEAFITYLAEGGEEPGPVKASAEAQEPDNGPLKGAGPSGAGEAGRFSRLWAFTRRETLELLRDRIRIGFALAIPILLLIIFSFGISFDVEHLTYAAFDRDRSAESQAFLRSFEGSRYFEAKAPVDSEAEGDRRLTSGELRLVVGIPPGFGKDLLLGRRPEVSIWIDGANTFRAETVRSYVSGLIMTYANELAREASAGSSGVSAPVDIRPRYLYNQAFQSVNAITPGVIMLVLLLVPAMMTALGVVREREIGSIANLEASPASVAEFLIGKQLAYVGIGMINVVSLLTTAVLAFGVPFNGSIAAFALGAMIYVFACTAFGLLISTVVSTQVAATFATAILSVIPAVNFSGFMYPIASVEGVGRIIGYAFPAGWFQRISLGTFAKGLGAADLVLDYAILAGFGVVFLATACLMLSKQEA